MASFKSRGNNKRRSKFGPKFERSRIADDTVNGSGILIQEVEKSDEEVPVPSDDSESEQEAKERPYNTLLNIFNVDPDRQGHRKKRRKVDKVNEIVDEVETLDDDLEDGDKVFSGESDLESDLEADEVNDHAKAEQEEEDGPESEDDAPQSDPFESHFTSPEDHQLPVRVEAVQNHGWSTSRRPLGKKSMCTLSSPKDIEMAPPMVPSSNMSLAAAIKHRLRSSAESVLSNLDETNKETASYVFAYNDLLHGARTPQNASQLRQLTCLHALNHVYKTRDKVLKHTARLADTKNPDLQFRDQGFTRPKVLILLPTRNSCAKVVESIVDICQPEQQENRKRFDDNFTKSEGDVPEERPEDFKELFAGNDDDMFRMGIKFTRKTIKYFTQFYNSDIIIASPLGLRNAIDSGDGRKSDYDYLSSIEIVVVDQTDAMLMQNWDHVTFVLAHLNLSPREAHGCDFSRVRMWYLNDQAKYLRQTIVLSAFITPEINSVFNGHMSNVFGKIKYQPTYDGSALTTGLSIKQTFSRFTSPSIQADLDARFKFFTSTIVPWILRAPKPPEGGPGILIFIPSYFDFVRIRNYFSTSPSVSSVSFGVVSENKSPAEPETRRARSYFLTGKHSVLLYTGRAHHFYRYMIKGVRNVVMYQLPDNPIFYKEIVAGFLNASITSGRMSPEEGRVRVLFSKWDTFKLERIVGTERLRTMLGAGDTFDFI